MASLTRPADQVGRTGPAVGVEVVNGCSAGTGVAASSQRQLGGLALGRPLIFIFDSPLVL
jgi:hypothetical protein